MEHVYRMRQRELLDELRSKSEYIIIFFDALYDSSKNIAHDIIVVINEQMSEVIQVIIKAQEKHYRRDSWKVKDPIIYEAIQHLRDAGIHISKAIYNDKNSVDQKFKKQLYDIKVGTHVLDIHSIDECTSSVQICKYTMKAIQE